MLMRQLAAAFLIFATIVPATSESPKPATPREALKPFNILVGSWKGAGSPEGTNDERQKGHWQETITWEWQFKDADAWLTVKFDKGKYFTGGELRQAHGKEEFQLTLNTVEKEKRVYTGTLKGKQLALEREVPDAKIVERLTFSLLHDNRITYR